MLSSRYDRLYRLHTRLSYCVFVWSAFSLFSASSSPYGMEKKAKKKLFHTRTPGTRAYVSRDSCRPSTPWSCRLLDDNGKNNKSPPLTLPNKFTPEASELRCTNLSIRSFCFALHYPPVSFRLAYFIRRVFLLFLSTMCRRVAYRTIFTYCSVFLTAVFR